ncbi:MAG: hypothetical protein JOZ17_23430, partial [Acetobacteraceae bacterium]|nr:hypothetical protein [Acetobacteraceae bacterium]
IATIKQTGQRWYLSELHRARGEILLKCSPYEMAEAETALMHAIEIARGQSAMLFELQAVVSLARLWEEQGKRVKAYDLLAPIFGWFTEGFDVPVLKEAKALLDELA